MELAYRWWVCLIIEMGVAYMEGRGLSNKRRCDLIRTHRFRETAARRVPPRGAKFELLEELDLARVTLEWLEEAGPSQEGRSLQILAKRENRKIIKSAV